MYAINMWSVQDMKEVALLKSLTAHRNGLAIRYADSSNACYSDGRPERNSG